MSMTPERAALKNRLMTERIVTLEYISPSTNRKVRYTGLCCELCAKKYQPGRSGPEFVPGLDMHEPIITRGNVRGNDRLIKLITESQYNAALVCNDCNLNRADSKWAVNLLTQKLVMRYGEQPIIDWITSLGLKLPVPYIQTVRIAAEFLNSTVEFKPTASTESGAKEINADPSYWQALYTPV